MKNKHGGLRQNLGGSTSVPDQSSSPAPAWTPGPWETRPMTKSIFIVQAHQFIENGIYVAEVSREAWRPDNRNNHDADARLIARAPDLYRILQALVDSAVSTRDVIAVDEWLIEEAKNELAKVRGES